jgi:catechol 2,3-dioxygenase-like lactoylglutathione lyase family enzyme
MTTDRSTFHSVTPMIPTGGTLKEALKFYCDQLGFTVVWEDNGMAGIRRGSVSFHLVVNHNREWADNSSYSIGVSDLDALYREYRHLPATIGPLEVKAGGRREFHMIVPSGVCLQFYQDSD